MFSVYTISYKKIWYKIPISSLNLRNWFWVKINKTEPIKYYYFIAKLSNLVKWKELKYNSNISFKKELKIDNLFKLIKVIKNVDLEFFLDQGKMRRYLYRTNYPDLKNRISYKIYKSLSYVYQINQYKRSQLINFVKSNIIYPIVDTVDVNWDWIKDIQLPNSEWKYISYVYNPKTWFYENQNYEVWGWNIIQVENGKSNVDTKNIFKNKTIKDIDWDWVPDTVLTNKNTDWTQNLTITVQKDWMDQQAISLKNISNISYVDLNNDWIKDIIAYNKINNQIWTFNVYIFDNKKKKYVNVFDQNWYYLKTKDFNWDWKLDIILKWTDWKIYLYQNNWLNKATLLTKLDWDNFDILKLNSDKYQDLVTKKLAWKSNWINYYYYSFYTYNNSTKKFDKVLWPVLWKSYKLININNDKNYDIDLIQTNSHILYYMNKNWKYSYLDSAISYSIEKLNNDDKNNLIVKKYSSTKKDYVTNVYRYLKNSDKFEKILNEWLWYYVNKVDLNSDWNQDLILQSKNWKTIYYYNSKSKKYEYLDAVKNFTKDYVRYYANTPVFNKSNKWYLTLIDTKWELRHMHYTNWKYVPAANWIIETQSPTWSTTTTWKSLKDTMKALWINFNWKTFSSMKLKEISIEQNWTWYNKILALQADPNTVVIIKPFNKFDDVKADYIVINKNKVWFTPNVDHLQATAVKKDNIYTWIQSWNKWLLSFYFNDSHYTIEAVNPTTYQAPTHVDLSKFKTYSKIINWVKFVYWSNNVNWYMVPYNPNTLENKIKDNEFITHYDRMNHKYKLTNNSMDLISWTLKLYYKLVKGSFNKNV